MNVRLVCRWLPLFLLSAAMFFSSFSYSQQKISGKITDENSAPLNGVSIVIKGSSTGTVTDEDGNFTITVPGSSSVLVMSYAGYLSREITAGSNTTVNVQLLPDIQRRDLNEVVVVGYGTQRKVDLTGAVASVTRKEIVNKPFTSPDPTRYLVGAFPV
jgi:TonB-dependent starch-binding outer membrane protein SusC